MYIGTLLMRMNMWAIKTRRRDILGRLGAITHNASQNFFPSNILKASNIWMCTAVETYKLLLCLKAANPCGVHAHVLEMPTFIIVILSIQTSAP